MSMMGTWISQQIGWLSWIPFVVAICQALLSFLVIVITIIAIKLLPGMKLKITSLIVGIVIIVIIWFV